MLEGGVELAERQAAAQQPLPQLEVVAAPPDGAVVADGGVAELTGALVRHDLLLDRRQRRPDRRDAADAVGLVQRHVELLHEVEVLLGTGVVARAALQELLVVHQGSRERAAVIRRQRQRVLRDLLQETLDSLVVWVIPVLAVYSKTRLLFDTMINA